MQLSVTLWLSLASSLIIVIYEICQILRKESDFAKTTEALSEIS